MQFTMQLDEYQKVTFHSINPSLLLLALCFAWSCRHLVWGLRRQKSLALEK